MRTPRVPGTTDWPQVSKVFRAGETNELEINCLFGGWGRSTGQAWFDEVALEPLAKGPGDELQAVVTIDPEAPPVVYSPLLVGGFIEHFCGIGALATRTGAGTNPGPCCWRGTVAGGERRKEVVMGLMAGAGGFRIRLV